MIDHVGAPGIGAPEAEIGAAQRAASVDVTYDGVDLESVEAIAVDEAAGGERSLGGGAREGVGDARSGVGGSARGVRIGVARDRTTIDCVEGEAAMVSADLAVFGAVVVGDARGWISDDAGRREGGNQRYEYGEPAQDSRFAILASRGWRDGARFAWPAGFLARACSEHVEYKEVRTRAKMVSYRWPQQAKWRNARQGAPEINRVGVDAIDAIAARSRRTSRVRPVRRAPARRRSAARTGDECAVGAGSQCLGRVVALISRPGSA